MSVLTEKQLSESADALRERAMKTTPEMIPIELAEKTVTMADILDTLAYIQHFSSVYGERR